ncbi:hypothetical protein ODR38_10035, partial [Pediococcus acidilactici]
EWHLHGDLFLTGIFIHHSRDDPQKNVALIFGRTFNGAELLTMKHLMTWGGCRPSGRVNEKFLQGNS